MRPAILALLLFPSLAFAQWQSAQKTDAFRGTQYTEFTLAGRFLTPPQHSSLANPVLILQCLPGRRKLGRWHYDGRFLDGYIRTGATLDAGIGKIAVQYRLDGGKVQAENWTPSTNLGAIFFDGVTLNNLLYGHFLTHKDGTTAPVHTVTVAVNEYMAGEVVMEFDLPDPSQPAAACGALMARN